MNVFCIGRFLEWLGHFATDQQEQEKLWELGRDHKALDLYFDYITRPRRTCLEVLEDFHSINISIDYILDIWNILRERSFSISSSHLMYPKHIHLTVAIVGYKTVMSTQRVGLCSQYLANLTVGDTINCWIKSSTMKMRINPVTFLPFGSTLFIGPGTGIAPCRALIQHQIHLYQSISSISVASREFKEWKIILIFGCRQRGKDQLYQEEFENYQRQFPKLFFYYTVFSRDDSSVVLLNGQPVKYVQHLLIKEQRQIWIDILNDHFGHHMIYLSGNAHDMPKEVKKALHTIMRIQGEMNEFKVLSKWNQLVQEHRWREETWY